MIVLMLFWKYTFGLSAPIPAFVYATGGSPPFVPDAGSPTDDNEPYLNVRGELSNFLVKGIPPIFQFIEFLLANPKTITTTSKFLQSYSMCVLAPDFRPPPNSFY